MGYKKIYLKCGKEASLQRFHPWVFSGAVARWDEHLVEGDIVEVCDSEGRFLAVGHYQIGSIMVRVLSFDPVEIQSDFWRERLQRAYQARVDLHLAYREGTDTFRLVHGEGDFLPGLIVDIYGATAVMQAHSVGMHRQRREIAETLLKVLPNRVYHVFYKSETTLPFKAETGVEDAYLIGGEEGAEAMENGLKFLIDWEKGQKTGFFIDQRDNRSLLERYAAGRTVLNMFCYTGGFSCYALRGNACQVHSVDSSAKAIFLTEKNVRTNFGDTDRHQAFAVDAFRFLDEIPSDAYDLIILDPPAFAKHREVVKNALQGYKRLNYKAISKITSGGILFTFSCSQAVSKEQFRLAVFSAAAMSGRRVRILHQLTQPADHPVNIYHPEGEYLKGLVLYVE